MRIGLPREIKDGEFRVALTPAGVAELTRAGHDVVFELNLGSGIGISNQEYERAGAKSGEPWECELVVKVKELQEPEYRKPREGQVVFGFQHFGPEPVLLDAALASGATFVAFETVGQDSGLPILAPMSAIAGRLAVQVGAWCLQKHNGGSGVLLPGAPGVPPGKVLMIGLGNVGSNALAVASGLGTATVVFAKTDKRFSIYRHAYPKTQFKTLGLAEEIPSADLVIGGVLTPGQMSPKLVTRAMLRAMRPGSALVDVGIDQGGIAETSRPTSHSDPVYVEEGVVHYCVPNMPAAVARTASFALERAVLPRVFSLSRGEMTAELKSAFQVSGGKVVHEFLARDTRRPYHPL